MIPSVKILQGDCRATLKTLPDESVHCVVTSPPYWGLRDYGCDGQIGLEKSLDDFIAKMVDVFSEVRRVLRKDGTCWVNIGDTYSSSAHKNLCGVPWRLAFAMQSDGWCLRQDIIWHNPNPMPESVRDRCTKAHEYLFLMTKAASYFWDADAMKEHGEFCGKQLGIVRGKKSRAESMGRKPSGNEVSGVNAMAPEFRNKRSVWTVCSEPYSEAHFATYPPSLIRPCILAGCPVGGTVLDPFGGSGTTGQVALELGRSAILCELNPEYVKLIEQRCFVTPGMPF